MDVRKAWDQAKATVSEYAVEIKRKTSAGAVKTLTRTEATRLAIEPAPLYDADVTLRKIQQAQESLQAARAKLSRGCGQ